MTRGQGAEWGAKLMAAIGLVCVVAGCGASEPYLFKRKEFDRDSPTFNKPRPEGEPVLICYNGWWTSEAAVLALAERECARYTSAIPLAVDERFGPCPVFVPRQAIFRCEGETKAPPPSRKTKEKKNKADTPQAPADGGVEAVPAEAPSAPAPDGSAGPKTAPDPAARLFEAEPGTGEDEPFTDASRP